MAEVPKDIFGDTIRVGDVVAFVDLKVACDYARAVWSFEPADQHPPFPILRNSRVKTITSLGDLILDVLDHQGFDLYVSQRLAKTTVVILRKYSGVASHQP